MASGINITLPKQDHERLTRLALRYGLSLPEFSRRVLREMSSDMAEESFNDYRNPRALKTSFRRALGDLEKGRVRTRL